MANLTQAETEAITNAEAIIRSDIDSLQRAFGRVSEHMNWKDYGNAYGFAKEAMLDAQKTMQGCNVLLSLILPHVPK